MLSSVQTLSAVQLIPTIPIVQHIWLYHLVITKGTHGIITRLTKEKGLRTQEGTVYPRK